jgi:hypothetical protein
MQPVISFVLDKFWQHDYQGHEQRNLSMIFCSEVFEDVFISVSANINQCSDAIFSSFFCPQERRALEALSGCIFVGGGGK